METYATFAMTLLPLLRWILLCLDAGLLGHEGLRLLTPRRRLLFCLDAGLLGHEGLRLRRRLLFHLGKHDASRLELDQGRRTNCSAVHDGVLTTGRAEGASAVELHGIFVG